MKSGQLRGYQIGRVPHVPEAVSGRYRELLRVVQPRIEERAAAMHFQICNKRVPVSNGTPPRPRVKVYAGQTEGGGNQRRGRNVCAGHNAVRDLLWVECLAVEEQFGVEFSRPPAS